MDKNFSLKGKKIWIVGGLGLIGKSVANLSLKLGGSVLVLDINCKNQKKNKIYYENFDSTNVENMEETLNVLEKKFGKVDVWVNASYPRTENWSKKNLKSQDFFWKENIKLHLNSFCLWSNVVAKKMSERNKGNIINLSSIYGVNAPDFSLYKNTKLSVPSAYTAIKGGIISHTKYIASLSGKKGIRANCICPGGILDKQPKIFIKRYNKKTFLNRMAKPQEIAWPICFLASDASSYITGTNISVDGGFLS